MLLLGGRAVFIWLFPHMPASEVSDLLLFRQKTWGGLGAALMIMLISAARDPRKHSVIVWAMAVGLAVAGIAEFLSIWLVGSARLFPMVNIVVHSLGRIGIALVLAYLEKRLFDDQKNRTPQAGGA